MRLKELLLSSGLCGDCRDAGINGIVYNSSAARPDTLFLCVKGENTDGHLFARDAYERGCRVFVCERNPGLPEDASIIITDNTRRALASLSAAFFNHPEKKLRLTAVTGTKGKTTVASMTAHVLNSCGIRTGLIGTTGITVDGHTKSTSNTTPESHEIFKALSEMAESGISDAVIEVSSQGIMFDRIYGIRFAAAVMTNLSRDHVGIHEHPSFRHYKETKKLLFGRADSAVLNADDKYYDEFRRASLSCPGGCFSYSVGGEADLRAVSPYPVKNGGFGVGFTVEDGEKRFPASLALPGVFSVSDALACASVCRLYGIPTEKSFSLLAGYKVSGRAELVPTTIPDVSFIIDYAHNKASLTSLLQSLKMYSPARIVCVFGSVGERSRERRRGLAEAASLYADFSVLTGDNPGNEPAEAILKDISEAMTGEYTVIPDRAEAIEYAVRNCRKGDFIVFAGKGHERYQLIGTEKKPFNEKELIIKAASDYTDAEKKAVLI